MRGFTYLAKFLLPRSRRPIESTVDSASSSKTRVMGDKWANLVLQKARIATEIHGNEDIS